jgi:hypothetical protein
MMGKSTEIMSSSVSSIPLIFHNFKLLIAQVHLRTMREQSRLRSTRSSIPALKSPLFTKVYAISIALVTFGTLSLAFM